MSSPHLSKLWLGGGAAGLLAVGFMAGWSTAPIAGGKTSQKPADERSGANAASSSRTSSATAARKNVQAATWNDRWTELQSQPASGERERAMLELLREQAAHDPVGALKLAGKETNVRFRQQLISAALREWAAVDPAASVNWVASNLGDEERKAAIEAIIASGMTHPDETADAISALCRRDVQRAPDYGRVLIETLGQNDDFDLALKFASQGTGDNRNYWYSTTFFSWAQYRPQEAATALKQISATDPAAGNEALHGLIYGWASNNPAELLDYALQLPAGDVRKTALNEAFQHWVTNDPEAASSWMASHAPSLDLDSGAVKIATSPDVVAKQPDVALGWAESVVDPQQRAYALTDIVQQWAARDPAAAQRYVESSATLSPDLRKNLLKEIANPIVQPGAP